MAMITKFLDVPLRYPVLNKDYCPDRFQFNCAIYLLNKDIAQIGSNSTVLSTCWIKILPR